MTAISSVRSASVAAAGSPGVLQPNSLGQASAHALAQRRPLHFPESANRSVTGRIRPAVNPVLERTLANDDDPYLDEEANRKVAAFKKMDKEGASLLGSFLKDEKCNPLTIRSWLFNMATAYGKADAILLETKSPPCTSSEKRIDDIVEIFRRNGMISLVAGQFELRRHFDRERARFEAERLIHHAFAGSISR